MNADAALAERNRKILIGFNNFAHAVDHYVMLIFPTVVIGLEAVYGRPYSELLALGTASFFAFGLFSLPAGWIADRWSRRYMMVVFYIGCGLSCAAAAVSPNFVTLAISLFALGVFASIYHPVGTAIVVAAAVNRGRTLALNGVCGNVGVALAAGITAGLTYWIGWRGAFLVPAVVCLATGVAYLVMVPDDRAQKAGRSAAPDVRLSTVIMLTVFAMFILIGTTAGLVFNTVTIALPKLVDERVGSSISLVAVGGISTAIFLCGAIAQFTMGRVLERYQAHFVFAFTGLMQFIGVVWVCYATGYALLAALAFAMTFIYAQVTVNDFVIARYTADAWRARVYAVRYFITYLISGAAISMIAFLHSRGGFDLVLTVTAVIALGFVIGTAAVALLVNGVERDAKAMQPAE
ncbi:MFS transporter [Rhodoplanes sp. Z2-YC6860]|uniref:MFS transporter n=1 Tax=Rhodoplanes sp. Z2-YC6860 TaxID=674703 RepID=UPI00078BC6EB|nr:MFS transporter [Rhodoplanes sp. Z2-YC6860]AMN41706.1 major facilitator superfamily protein [Rhodoplanes sp. Z2-YC6860]